MKSPNESQRTSLQTIVTCSFTPFQLRRRKSLWQTPASMNCRRRNQTDMNSLTKCFSVWLQGNFSVSFGIKAARGLREWQGDNGQTAVGLPWISPSIPTTQFLVKAIEPLDLSGDCFAHVGNQQIPLGID